MRLLYKGQMHSVDFWRDIGLCTNGIYVQCEEKDLRQIFSEFGTVIESKIPLKPGKCLANKCIWTFLSIS